MRIEPTGTPQIAPTGVGPAPRSGARTADAPADAGSFAPSSDLTALLAAVRLDPDVRAAAVAAAVAKLAAGALDTQAAAADTAKAFLDSGDGAPAG